MRYNCLFCSLYKGSNPAGFDFENDTLHPLFNPRTQKWDDNFAWNGATLKGLTSIGRATINVLRINEPLRIRHRELLIQLEVFPPRFSMDDET